MVLIVLAKTGGIVQDKYFFKSHTLITDSSIDRGRAGSYSDGG
jgi:hypothetical protein